MLYSLPERPLLPKPRNYRAKPHKTIYLNYSLISSGGIFDTHYIHIFTPNVIGSINFER